MCLVDSLITTVGTNQPNAEYRAFWIFLLHISSIIKIKGGDTAKIKENWMAYQKKYKGCALWILIWTNQEWKDIFETIGEI